MSAGIHSLCVCSTERDVLVVVQWFLRPHDQQLVHEVFVRRYKSLSFEFTLPRCPNGTQPTGALPTLKPLVPEFSKRSPAPTIPEAYK